MGKTFKKKINLFFCINSLEKGGAEKQLSYLTNYLCNNYNIFIFTFSKSKNCYKFKPNIKIYNLKNIFFFLYFIKKVLTIKPKFVFFVLPKSYFLFGTIMIFFPKIKSILMRRSLNYYHKNFLIKYYEIFLHNFTDHFICNSFSAKKDLIETEYVSKRKVSVIDNYIKLDYKKIKTKKNSKFKILCISNFYKYKGHFLLFKSLSFTKSIPWELYLMGQSKNINKKNFIKMFKNLGIQNNIKFIKKIDRNYSYPNFSLGVLFSETESFSNAILEYLSLKLPVMAFDVGDNKRLINKKNGKLLKKRNPIHISKEFQKIYFDNQLNNKSKNSFKKIKKFSSIKNTLEKYHQILENKNVWNIR